MNLKVTIRKVFNDERRTKAIADVLIDNTVVIHGVRVRKNEKGHYITMPNKQWKNKLGETVRADVAHPISSSGRSDIQDAVLAAYENELQENSKNI